MVYLFASLVIAWASAASIGVFLGERGTRNKDAVMEVCGTLLVIASCLSFVLAAIGVNQ